MNERTANIDMYTYTHMSLLLPSFHFAHFTTRSVLLAIFMNGFIETICVYLILSKRFVREFSCLEEKGCYVFDATRHKKKKKVKFKQRHIFC